MGVPDDIAALQARVAALEHWVQAFETGPIGNVPWADRPVPPPADDRTLMMKRQAIHKNEASEP